MSNIVASALQCTLLWVDGGLFFTGHWLLGLLLICAILYGPFTSQPTEDRS